MSFGVIQYKSPFRPIPRNRNHVCGFCGTRVDVKYSHDVDSSDKYPEESRETETSIYSCSSCTLRRMFTFPNHQFDYDFNIADPYKFMSTLQRMYKDLETQKTLFHKTWVYCYGCKAYVRVEDSIVTKDEDRDVLKCATCDSVLRD